MSKYQLLGDYACRLDTKGRLKLPADLLKQLMRGNVHRFVLKKSPDGCLVLYPEDVWQEKTKCIEGLNPLIKEERALKRAFYRGARYVRLDEAGRILIPQALLEFAGIERSVVVLAMGDEVEIWNEAAYRASEAEDQRVQEEVPRRIWSSGERGAHDD